MTTETKLASKAANTQKLRNLDKHAKGINKALDSATKALDKADDYRLIAAQELATTKAECGKLKLKFKPWAEKHLTHSYETVRKLVPIGEAENKKAGQGAAMLSEMRNKNKVANKKLRDNKTQAAKAAKASEVARMAEQDKAIEAAEATQAAEAAMPIRTSEDVAKEAFERMGASSQQAFIKWAQEMMNAKKKPAKKKATSSDDMPDFLKRAA